MKELKITCSAMNCIDYKSIIPFQGNLKRRGDRDIEKLCNSIIELGISYPFVIWKDDDKNHCIDGHGRLIAFEKLEKEGYIIPPVPIVEIFAENKEEAIKKLIYNNCKYGDMTYESVMEFIGDSNLDMFNFQLPTGKMVYDSGINFNPGSFEVIVPSYLPQVDLTGKPVGESRIFYIEKISLELSEEEAKMLNDELNIYVKENNGLFGFVSNLLGG
jgi:hypothetical protein